MRPPALPDSTWRPAAPPAGRSGPTPDALLQSLDHAAAPLSFFIRDDDAGWGDDALLTLLDLCAAAEVPIDLAVIPDAMTDALASRLRARTTQQPLGLHQHGCSHANHEPAGRKCEFGPARSREQRRADLVRGRQQLQDRLGDRLDPFFTPPWNRCTPDTPALLRELGYAALSRDASAQAQGDLPELPVHVDWTRELREARAAGVDPLQQVSVALARHAKAGKAVGLMLHHAVMDDAERDLLARGLARWSVHPHARWCPMRDLAVAAGR